MGHKRPGRTKNGHKCPRLGRIWRGHSCPGRHPLSHPLQTLSSSRQHNITHCALLPKPPFMYSLPLNLPHLTLTFPSPDMVVLPAGGFHGSSSDYCLRRKFVRASGKCPWHPCGVKAEYHLWSCLRQESGLISPAEPGISIWQELSRVWHWGKSQNLLLSMTSCQKNRKLAEDGISNPGLLHFNTLYSWLLSHQDSPVDSSPRALESVDGIGLQSWEDGIQRREVS